MVNGVKSMLAHNHRIRKFTIFIFITKNLTQYVRMCREKASVWMGMCGDRTLVGPIFDEKNFNENGYLNLLNEGILPPNPRKQNEQVAVDSKWRSL